MQNIELYSDYRQYLRDYYEESKNRWQYFSYRYFSNKAGIKSPAFYRHVASGERNLTDKTIAAFAIGLGLDAHQTAFFTALVHFNQAKSALQKQEALQRMRGLLPKISEQVVPSDLYAYYSHWYNIAIRELACIFKWDGDYTLLARKVKPAVTRREAHDAVDLLIRIGMLYKKADGTYVQSSPHLTTKSEVMAESVRNVNRQFTELALYAIDNVPATQRDISSMTIGLSEDEFRLVKSEIQYFKDRIKSILAMPGKPDRVYNLNVQFFPISESIDIPKAEDLGGQE